MPEEPDPAHNPKRALPPERRRLILTGIALCCLTLVVAAAWIFRHAPLIGRMAAEDPKGTRDVVLSLWWLWLILLPAGAVCVRLLVRILQRRRL